MFFILSKLLLLLIQPIFWVFLFLVWALLAKKTVRKKRLLYTAFGLLFFFSNPYILRQVTRFWDIPSQNIGTKHYSCAIILGGFTTVDADNNGFFNGASSRFIKAVELKVSGRADKLLLSGGSGLLLKGSTFKEADIAALHLKILNIPDSTLLIENQSRNTIENAIFSKKILAEKKIAGPYLLVTSAFHMRRALYTFKKAGIDVIAQSSDYGANHGSIGLTDIIPSADALSAWDDYTKEMMGYIVYRFKSF